MHPFSLRNPKTATPSADDVCFPFLALTLAYPYYIIKVHLITSILGGGGGCTRGLVMTFERGAKLVPTIDIGTFT